MLLGREDRVNKKHACEKAEIYGWSHSLLIENIPYALDHKKQNDVALTLLKLWYSSVFKITLIRPAQLMY